MEFPSIPIGGVWTLVKWLPTFLLKRHFSKDRLAELVYVDLRPRHDSAVVDFGESASYDLWLNIINLSPFEIELDRAEFRFVFGGIRLTSAILKRQRIHSGEIAQIHVSAVIPDGTANQSVRNYTLNPEITGWLEGSIEFNCSLHSFPKEIRNLSGVTPRVRNEKFRQNRE
ncbi:hypothetical protein [Herbaspirillum sp.]|uniref:hypothetical protein n=1 Tax=Herbaspirillum sp. TaxID=1890675 RepID=UPI001B189E92|nr:hypothetical protein [Herbaspirillum sp.]MBO9537785.1 hypothetical protein [Herbaspirillum sp.]